MMTTDEGLEQRHRVRVCLSRLGPSKALSHLEYIQVVRRALSGSGLPLLRKITAGRRIAPRMRVAFGPALPAGYESLAEWVDFELSERVDLEIVRDKLNAGLFREVAGGLSDFGIRILAVKRVPLHFPALEASANVVEYELQGEFSPGIGEILSWFMQQKEYWMAPAPKPAEPGAAGASGNPRRVYPADVRGRVIRLEPVRADTVRAALRFGLNPGGGSGAKVRPEDVVGHLLARRNQDMPAVRVLRVGFYTEDSKSRWISP
ncbi:MAG: DUF2344 domain-containing protein [Elusimicrobia bacterium]|nr:DUF2344 domain-containing protein [Elusimicrobiota bacterium]